MALTKHSTAIAVLLLAFMGFVAVSSISKDAVTTDEAPHITAGYSYLKYRDFRLNPEHPPLIKDLAAFPLLFKDLNFPLESPAWQDMVNAQWDLAPEFLYNSENDPDEIIFWGRMGPILLMLVFGWFVFRWARELYGAKWGIFCLGLFVFSPTIMAHGRLVTTDIAAAFAFFSSIYFYLKFLKQPSRKNLIFAAVMFAVAQLLKFSSVLLLVLLPIVTLVWILINNRTYNIFAKPVLREIFLWKWRFLKILCITVVLITIVYQFHVLSYPVDKQIADISHILGEDRLSPLREALVWMSDKPILRAFGQYVLGISMVFLRVQGGNTTYFLGEVSNQAWLHYFPVVFALKTPFAVLAFIALSLALFFKNTFSLFNKKPVIAELLKNNFAEITMLIFVVFYWTISVTGNLNIGVRHVLPTFPFIYLLIAGQMQRWMASHAKITANARTPILLLRELLFSTISESGKTVIIALLLMLNISAFAGIYPHYLAYFNAFAGGPDNGYTYAVDSNLDWGQDLRRLAEFVESNGVSQIKVDYFGGGNVKYYLGDKAVIWHADNGPTTGWLAVSATYYQTSRAYPGASYEWLDAYEPEEKIGYSIFVYNIND